MQVLSNLRNLQSTVIKILEEMPYAIDLSKDPFFSKEFARAKTTGKAEGIAEGEAKVIANLLENGRFSVEEIAEFSKMSIEFVLGAQKQLNLSKKERQKKK